MPVSIPPSKDIPPARRQSTDVSLDEIENIRFVAPKRKPTGLRWVAGLLLVAGIGSVGYWQRAWLGAQTGRVVGGVRSAIAQVNPARSAGEATAESEPSSSEPSILNSADDSDQTGAGDVAPADQLLNHRRYDVADEATLVPLTPDSEIRLKPDAKAAVTRMLEKARAEGVQLDLVSGFRTLDDQNYLYFDLKAERGESAQTRAEVSAPPGYSEHHTGYAVDFIDKSRPSTHLEESFEDTEAFKWLEANAAFFNFEMSFQRDNEAQVGYEPWHWRYVGNQESLELFYK